MTLVKGVADPLEKTAKLLAILFITLLFLSAGADAPGQFYLKLGLGFVLLILGLAIAHSDHGIYSTKSSSLILFLCFVGFLFLRFLLALLILLAGQSPAREIPMLLRFLSAPLGWSYALGLMAIGFVFFRLRKDVHRLLWAVSSLGFFLAINAVPRLLMGGATKEIVTGYLGPEGRMAFFFPIFYFRPWVEELILSRAIHSNFAGDVIALGFFPSLGGFLYLLGRSFESKQSVKIILLSLFALFAGTMALAVTLLFSRGTIICFALALLIYTVGILLKYPSNARFTAVGLALALVFGFVFWGGNVPGMLNELWTVPKEFQPEGGGSSLAISLEGGRRAWAIYQDFPILGAGTGGYGALALKYATAGTDKMALPDFTAMSHYLQLLAEEGAGALFYFLFLLVYIVGTIRRLVRVHSGLQFLAGFSLFVPVVMILLHASIHHLMEGFSVSSLVYLYIGASLGILSQGFSHGRHHGHPHVSL